MPSRLLLELNNTARSTLRLIARLAEVEPGAATEVGDTHRRLTSSSVRPGRSLRAGDEAPPPKGPSCSLCPPCITRCSSAAFPRNPQGGRPAARSAALPRNPQGAAQPRAARRSLATSRGGRPASSACLIAALPRLRVSALQAYINVPRNSIQMPEHLVIYILGRRQAGKSSLITREIGNGADALVVVETEHDKAHHSLHSPGATICAKHDVHSLTSYRVIVLDNVVQFNRLFLARRTLRSNS
jgi:hypothetical protein